MTDDNVGISLGEALPAQMARVRDEILPYYEMPELSGAGRIAAAMMRADLDAAAKAMAEGDTIEMMKVYVSLREYQV